MSDEVRPVWIVRSPLEGELACDASGEGSPLPREGCHPSKEEEVSMAAAAWRLATVAPDVVERMENSPEERLRAIASAVAHIQLFVRLYDVDAWARGMGYALDLGDPNVPEEVWSDRREESDVSPADLARRCVDALANYEQVLGLRESEEGRELLQTEDFRRATCSEIAQGRAWVVWTRGHLASEVEPVALVMLAVAQGSFVLGCMPDDAAEVFPTLEYVRMLLAKTDANEWLLEQGPSCRIGSAEVAAE